MRRDLDIDSMRGWRFEHIEGMAIINPNCTPTRDRLPTMVMRFPYYEKPMDCTVVSMDGNLWTIYRRSASLNAWGSDVFIGTFGVDFFNEKA